MRYFLSIFILLILFTTSQGQEKIDYQNIVSFHYTNIGVPKGKKMVLYGLHSKKWEANDSLDLPTEYMGLDGNIRTVYILKEDKMVFLKFFGEKNDTLLFDDKFAAPAPKYWIRTPHSTEQDFSVYQNEKEITTFSDGGEWSITEKTLSMIEENKTTPVLQMSAPFKKLFHFENNSGMFIAAVFEDKITFHQLRFRKDIEDALKLEAERKNIVIPTAESMTLALPSEAESALIFDYNSVAVVFSEKILFYKFDNESQKWIENKYYPEFLFKD